MGRQSIASCLAFAVVAIGAVTVAAASPELGNTSAPPVAPPPKFAPRCCSELSRENILDTRGYGSLVIPGLEDGFVNTTGISTMVAWVRLVPGGSNSRSYIFARLPYPWDAEQSGFGLYWDHDMNNLQVEMTVAGGNASLPPNRAGSDASQLHLPNGDWRMVSLEINAATGTIIAYVDLVEELRISFPALVGRGINTTRALIVGCKDYANQCINGYMADVFTTNRSLTDSDREIMYSYRQCPDSMYSEMPSPVSAPWLFCPRPVSGLRQFYRGNTNSWSPYEGPAGSTPSGYGMRVTGELQFRPFEQLYEPSFTERSWTPAQAANQDCGSSQTFTLTSPRLLNGTYRTGWGLDIQLNGSGAVTPNKFSVYIGNSDSEADKLGDISVRVEGVASLFMIVPLRFIPDSMSLRLTIAASHAICPMRAFFTELGTGSVEIQGTAAGGNIGFAGTGLDGVLVSAPGTSSGVGGIVNATETDCTKAGVVVTATPGGTGAPATIFFPPMPAGTYRFCAFPTGKKDNQGILLKNVPNFTSGTLRIAPLPIGGAPLRTMWITDMLRLGSTLDAAIPNAYIDVDYFAAVGGEASIQPRIYDIFNDGDSGANGGNLSWTPTEMTTAVWGEYIPTLSVDYLALGLYTPEDQGITFSIRHNYAARVWIDSVEVYEYSIPDGGSTRSFGPVALTTGWHQVIVKYNRYIDQSMLKLRANNGFGLAWAFEMPGASGHGNVPYNDTCAAAGQAVGFTEPCIPGSAVGEGECFSIGCCWKSGTCYARPGSRLPYRRDGRCGPSFPAPGAAYGQCDKDNFVGASCCSPHGWCGNSTYHCTCAQCINYRYDNSPRCRYQSICTSGSGCACASTDRTFIGNMSRTKCEETCDFTASCRGFSYSVYGQCFFLGEQCTVQTPDSTMIDTKNRYCNCSFRDDCPNKNCKCSSLEPWREMPGRTWSAAQCQAECRDSFSCVSYNWVNGSCWFLTSACGDFNPGPSGLSVYKIYTCPGLNDVFPTVPSNTSFINGSSSTALGCYNDPQGELMFWNPSFPTVNLYRGDADMTVQTCQDYCLTQGALFFALFNASTCKCGMRQPKHGLVPVDQKECKLACPGQAGTACGGLRASLLYATTPSTAGCAMNGTYRFGDSCYWLNRQELNFSTAVTQCVNMGGQLASAGDIPDAQFAMGLPFALNTSDSFTTYRMWIGGAADNVRGRFEWIDGRPWQLSSWRLGEPNSFAVEDCVEALSNYATPWAWKGTWNNVNCAETFISVCRIPALPDVLPRPAAEVAGHQSTLACSLAGTYAPIQATMQLQLPLESTATNAVTGTGVTSTVVYNASSGVSTPTFVSMSSPAPAKMLEFLRGEYYLNVTGPALTPALGSVSVCAWVMPQDVSNTRARNVFLSKLRAGSSYREIDYELGIEYNQFCFFRSWYRVCGGVPMQGTAAHVCGTASDSSIALYVNGRLARRMSVSLRYFMQEDSAFVPTPLIVGAQPEQWGSSPGSVTNAFTGFLGDVRVYNSELSDSCVLSLGTCTGLGAAPTELPVYRGAATNITLFGHGMYAMPSVEIKAGPCPVPSTGFGGDFVAPLFNQGTSSARVMISGRALVHTAPRVCMPDPAAMNNGGYPVDSGIRLLITSVDSFVPNGGNFSSGSTEITLSSNELNTMLKVAGRNLRPGMSLVMGQDESCAAPVLGTDLMSINSNGTEAGFFLMLPDNLVPTMYVCWAPAKAEDFNLVTSYFTGLLINIKYANELVVMAKSNGAFPFGPTQMHSGVSYDQYNYAMPCQSTEYFQGATAVQVVVGLFADYYVLRPGQTLCNFLTTSAMNATARYTHVGPHSNLWDGRQYTVPPNDDASLLGGSAPGFPIDDRLFLNSWGSRNPDLFGACCQERPGQRPAWGRGFTVTAFSVPKTNVYLQVRYPANVIYPGRSYNVPVKLVNVFGDKFDDGNGGLQHFTLSCNGHGSDGFVTKVKAAGSYDFPRDGTDSPVGTVFSCNVTTDYAVANANPVSFTVRVEALQPNALVLDNAVPVKTMLKLGSPTQFIVPANDSTVSPIEQDFLAVSGGEASQRPQAWQAAATNDANSQTYQWTADHQSGGIFGQSVSSGAVRVMYFAMAVYAPIDQRIELTVDAVTTARVYVDGSLMLTAVQGITTTTPDFPVTAGWHQVILKLVTYGAITPQLAVQANGIGLQYYFQLPAQLPEGATQLAVNTNIQSLLHLGTGSNAAIDGAFSSVNVIDTDTAQPKEGDVAGPLTWAVSNGVVAAAGQVFLWPQSNAAQGAVAYYAVAIYATSQSAYTFNFGFAGAFEVYMNGAKIVAQSANSNPTAALTQDLYLGAGWHQLIFKLGATPMGGSGSLSVSCATAGLGWALQMPASVPPGAIAVPAGPLTQFLQLEGPMSPAAPGATFTGIPYVPPANPTAAVVPAADFSTDVQPAVNGAQPVTVAANGRVLSGFSWQPRMTSTLGTWGTRNEGLGGGYTSYWATQLYSGVNQSVTPASTHYGDLIVYLDGAVVTHEVGATLTTPAEGTPFFVAQGWHTLIMRLEVPTNFVLRAAPGPVALPIAANNASHVCAMFKQELCPLQAYCPYGSIRPDGAANVNTTTFAPFRTAQGAVQWVQLDGQQQCVTTAAMPPASQRTSAGCCGSQIQHKASLELRGSSLAMSYGRPLVPLPVPIITVLDSDSDTPRVAISTDGAAATIFVTLDGTTPSPSNGMRYTQPISINGPTVVKAVTVSADMTRSSDVATVTVTPASAVQPGRLQLVQGAGTTPIQLGGASSGDGVVLIASNDPRVPQARNSANANISPDGQFSGLLRVVPYAGAGGGAGPVLVNVPGSLAAGDFTMFHFTADAVAMGTPASVVIGTFTVAIPVVTPNAIPVAASVNLTVTGGIVDGDALLLQPNVTADNCGDLCNGITSAPTSGIAFNDAGRVRVPARVGSQTTVVCACYLATGSAPRGWADPWSPLTVNISARNDVPPPTNEFVRAWVGATTGIPTGGTVSFVGTFDAASPQSQYTVALSGGSSAAVPTCTVIAKNTTAVTCRLVVAVGTSGQWAATVMRSGAPLPAAAGGIDGIVVLPPAPTFSSVVGSCATDSAQCTLGAALTITGANFDYVTRQLVTVEMAPENGAPAAVCQVQTVTETQIVCTLSNKPGTPAPSPWKGKYVLAIVIIVDITATPLTTGAIGTLSVGGSSSDRGFSGNSAPDGPTAGSPDHSKSNAALIAVVAVLAVIVVGGAVAFVITRVRSGSSAAGGAAANNRHYEAQGGDDYLPMTEAAIN